MADIPQKLHALLFMEGGPLTYRTLARTLQIGEAEVRTALDTLAGRIKGTGLELIRSDTEATLAVSPEARETAAQALRDESERAIGDAGLEILAILLYEGPATRAEIDYIRGVNSSSSLRLLLTRGLIERAGNPADGREYLYRPTTELLAHLGVGKREDLPEYGTIAPELAAFKARGSNHESGGDTTGNEGGA